MVGQLLIYCRTHLYDIPKTLFIFWFGFILTPWWRPKREKYEVLVLVGTQKQLSVALKNGYLKNLRHPELASKLAIRIFWGTAMWLSEQISASKSGYPYKSTNHGTATYRIAIFELQLVPELSIFYLLKAHWGVNCSNQKEKNVLGITKMSSTMSVNDIKI